MTRWRALSLTGFVVFGTQGWMAQGQILHASGERPSFEVATIKPWRRTPPPPSDGTSSPDKPPVKPPVKVMKVAPVGGGGGQATNRVHAILPTSLLIAAAYGLPVGSEGRLVKGPESLRQDTDQWEIEAKIDDSLFAAMQKMTPAQQREQVALMEQSLLADRFHLKVHFEMTEMPVYGLVVAKSGMKLTTTPEGETTKLSSSGNAQEMTMTASAVTLDQFVVSPFLTGAAGRQVLDQTDMKGKYDFTLRWAPDGIAEAPSLFTAIQEQLGLRLVPSKAPVAVIIVDHIEPPSAN